MRIRFKLALAFAALSLAGLLTSLVASYQAVRAAALHRLETDVDRAVVDFQRRIQELRRVAEMQVGTVLSQNVYADALSGAGARNGELGLGASDPAQQAREERDAFDKGHDLFASADLLSLKGTPGASDRRELVVLLNGSGKVLYNDAHPDAYTQSLAQERIVKEALAGGMAADLWSSRYVGAFQPSLAPSLAPSEPEDLYLVLAQPVRRGDFIIGAMLLGQRVTGTLLPDMERGLRGARVVLQAQDQSVATLDSEARAVTGVDSTHQATSQRVAGVSYLVRSQDVHQDSSSGGPLLGKVFVLLEFEGELQESLGVFWRWMLPLAALTLLGAVLATYFLSKWMADPLIALEKAAGQVRLGDLNVVVSAYGKDEVARLAVAFNEMVSGLRQRDQIKGLFKRYLNPAVVDELIKHPEKASPGGERRHLTVLFSDLVGFTTLSESMSPEELVTLLNQYFEQASQALAARGATLDKFIGDAIMCFWNAPLPQEDHAARACLAALDLIEVVDRLRPELQKRGVASFECRIGVNTGPCIVGNIGSTNAQDYTVIGDTVNLASRLEGAAKVYGTRSLVAHETVEAARDAVLARELDWLRVKGKAQPVRVYEVLGPAGMTPPAHLAAYARGLALYRERRFQEALDAFTDISGVDPAARVFTARCARLLAEPPEPGWDGVHSLESK